MYRCLSKSSFIQSGYTLTAIRKEDMESIRVWRNEQMDILRQQKVLSPEDQEQYYNTVIVSSFTEEEPKQILFSLFKDAELIGYGGIVHIDWEARNGEISFLIQTERNKNIPQFQEDFSIYLSILERVAYEDLSFEKLYTTCYDLRPYLIETLEQQRYSQEACYKKHRRIGEELVDVLVHAKYRDCQSVIWNVLVTSANQKISLIKDVKKAVTRLSTSNRVIVGDVNPDCIARYFADDFWCMSKTDELSLEVLLDYCKVQNIKYIIPSRDAELFYWAKWKAELESYGIKTMVSSTEALQNCLDKLAFSKICSHGLLSIATSEDIDVVIADSYVVKERYGAGSRKVVVDVSREEALEVSGQFQSPIYQPYVKGVEVTADIFLSEAGEVRGLVCRYRNLVSNGESLITTIFRSENLESELIQLAELIGLAGHINIQVILGENDEVFLLECNPRYGGASSISLAAGLDSFYWFMSEQSFSDDEVFVVADSFNGFKQIRYPSNRFVYGIDI